MSEIEVLDVGEQEIVVSERLLGGSKVNDKVREKLKDVVYVLPSVEIAVDSIGWYDAPAPDPSVDTTSYQCLMVRGQVIVCPHRGELAQSLGAALDATFTHFSDEARWDINPAATITTYPVWRNGGQLDVRSMELSSYDDKTRSITFDFEIRKS